MKKLFLICISMFSYFQVKASLQNEMIDMLPNTKVIDNANGTGIINTILIYIRDSLFAFIGLIAVGVFLYFGFKLISARGNEEEFKKTLKGFVYAVIGLAIVPLAYLVVSLVASLDF